MPRYYVEMDGYRYGPFDLNELGQLRRDGVIPGGCRAAEEHSDVNGTVDQLLAAHPDEAPPGPVADAAPKTATEIEVPATAPLPEVTATPVPASTAPVQAAAPSQPQIAAAPRTSWSERLAQLRAHAPAPATQAVEAAVHNSVVPEPALPFAEPDTPATEAAPANPPRGTAIDLPEPLLAGGSNIEPDVQYASALKEDPPAPISPDDTLPSLNLGGHSKPPIAGADSDLPPLGYAAHEAAEDAPPEWITKAPPPVVQRINFDEGGPASVSEPDTGPEPSNSPLSTTAPQPAANPAALIQEAENAGPPEEMAPQADPATAGLGGSWKERMSRLDEVYGSSPKMPPMPAAVREPEAGAMPESRSSAIAAEIAGKTTFEDDGETALQSSSTLLAGVAVLVAGAIGIMAGFELLEVSAGPALILAGSMASSGALTAIAGLLLCFRLRWAGVMAAVLLVVPLAVLGLAGYYQKEALMALKIPAELVKPMTYGLASLLMSALGVSLSRKCH